MDKSKKLNKKLFKKCLKITKKYLRGSNTCIYVISVLRTV